MMMTVIIINSIFVAATMENTPQLSLKWTHFKENFTSQFECLKNQEDFVDVTLACQGKLFRAHKVILSAASPYLTALFKENPCKHPVLIFDDLPSDHLESLLRFIYTGAVSVPETELYSFIESANTLHIRGLSEASQNDQPSPKKRPSIDEPDPVILPKKKQKTPQKFEEDKPTKTEKVIEPVIHEPTTPDPKKQHSLDPRRCPICNRLYSNLSNLRQHLRLIHNPTIVTCKLCSKPFKTDLYLRRHLSSYHGENLSPDLGETNPGPPLFRETRSKLKTNLL